MKIEVREDYTIQLEEVYAGITIKTREGVEFHICQRDYGIEVSCNGIRKYLADYMFVTKEQQGEILKEMIQADEKDGLYDDWDVTLNDGIED